MRCGGALRAVCRAALVGVLLAPLVVAAALPAPASAQTLPSVSIEAVRGWTDEGDEAEFVVKASWGGASPSDLSVKLDVTEAAPYDYVPRHSSSDREGDIREGVNQPRNAVTIPAAAVDGAGDGEVTIRVPTITGDSRDKDQPNGAVTVSVRTDAAYSTGSSGSAKVTIRDMNPTLVIIERDGPQVVYEQGHKAGLNQTKFTVTISRALDGGEKLKLPIEYSGDATLRDDYRIACEDASNGITCGQLNGPSAHIAFDGDAMPPGGKTTVTLVLTAQKDNDPDTPMWDDPLDGDPNLVPAGRPGEEFGQIRLGAPTVNVKVHGGVLTPRIGLFTIVDNAVTVDLGTNAEDGNLPYAMTLKEGGADADKIKTYEVVLESDPMGPVTISIIADADGDGKHDKGAKASVEIKPSNRKLNFTRGNWDTPQTVTVTARDDSDIDAEPVEIKHTAKASLRGSSDPSPYDGIAIQDVLVRVVDDDDMRNAASIARKSGQAATVREGLTGGDEKTLTFTVTLAQAVAAGDINQGGNTGETGLTVNYTVSDALNSNFLKRTDTRESRTMRRSVKIPLNQRTVDIEVGLRDNNKDEPDGPVTVQLIADDDPDVGGTYKVSDTTSQTFARVTVRDNEVPLLTVSSGCTRSERKLDGRGNPVSNNGEPVFEDVTYPATITEGQDACWTFTMDPKPWQPITFNGWVQDAGSGSDFVESGWELSQEGITVGVDGTGTWIVPTTDDAVQEPDGNLRMSVNNKWPYSSGFSGYLDRDFRTTTESSLSNTQAEASVMVQDNDSQAPVVTITGGPDVVEGQPAVFTLTANPAPTANFSVAVGISETGGQHKDPGVLAVEYVTFASGETTKTLRIGTVDDSVDEEKDGTIEADIETYRGSGTGDYKVGRPKIARVTVRDDVQPRPTVTISGPASITAGEDAVFTLTAKPAPSVDITVQIEVSETGSGDYLDDGSSEGTHTVTIAANTTTGTLTISTADSDTDQEPDGKIIASVLGTAEYTDGRPSIARVTVVDDDVPVITVTADQTMVTERRPNNAKPKIQFTVSSDIAPSSNLKVKLELADVSGSDFITSEGPKEVTIRAGKLRATLDVRVDNDNVKEDSGYVTLTVQPAGDSGEYTVGDPSVASVAVIDDDLGAGLGPQVSIAAAETTITEGDSAVFTLTVDPTPAADITVNVEIRETGGNVVHPRGQLKTHSVTISGGASTGTLPITTQDDNQAENNGVVKATVLTGTGYTPKSGMNSVEVTVTDDDTTVTLPEVEIEGPAGNVAEGASAVFTVTSSVAAPAGGLTVLLHVDDAASPRDFVVAGQEGDKMVTILATETSATYDVPITQDTVLELAGSIEVSIRASATAYTIKSMEGSATASVARNDDLTVRFSAATYTAAEGASASGMVRFTSGTASMPVNVQILRRLNTGDSAETADFTSTSVTVTIPAGMSSVAFTAPTTEDTHYEGDEVFSLAIPPGALPIGVTRGTPNVAKVTITDDDTPVISIAAGASPVTEAAGANASFTIKSDIGIENPLDVSVNVTETGAFVASTNEGAKTATFAADTTAPFEYVYNVPIVNDTTDEANGNVTVAVQTGTGYTRHATVSMRTATVAVQDDDVPRVSITGGAAVTEGGNAQFTVTVDRTPAVALSVGVTVAEVGSGAFLASGQAGVRTLTFAAGATGADLSQTVTATTDNDTVDELNGAVKATLNAAGAGYVLGSPTVAQVSVADNDVPQVSVSGGTAVTEGQNAPFTITVDRSPAVALTVNLTVANVSGSDYLASGEGGAKTVSVAAGATGAALTIVYDVGTDNDSVDEANGTVRVTVNAGTGYEPKSGMNFASVTVNDNDTPVISIAAGPSPVTEGTAGAQVSFTLMADIAPHADISVRLNVQDAPGSGYIANGRQGARTQTITAGTTSAIYTAAVQDDNTDELDGNVTATLTTPTTSAYTIATGAAATASVLVRDDDVPVVTISGGTPVTEGAPAPFTLSFTTPPAVALLVNVTVADAPSADFVDDDDYEGATAVSVAASAASKVFNLPTVGGISETADEPSGPVTVTLTADTATPATYTVGSANTATVTVRDDDRTVVELEVSGGTPPPLTEGGTRAVTLRLPRALHAGEGVVVPIVNFTTDGHATRGTDYTLACPSPLPAGFACNSMNTTSGTVTVTGQAGGSAVEMAMTLSAADDGAPEPGGELVNLGVGTITVPAGKTLDGGTGTWDRAPQFKLNDPPANPVNLSVTGGGAITEGDSALTVTAALGSPNTSGAAIAIPIAIGAGTTAQAGDYTLGATSISIANNASSGTTSFTVNNDSGDEPDEQVILELGATLPSGIGQGANDSVTVTITDNDPTPVSVSAPAGAIPEAAGTKAITVTLGRALVSPESLTVPLVLSGAADVGADYSLACPSGVSCAGLATTSPSVTFTGGTSPASAALTLTAVGDSVDEDASESVTVALGALGASSGSNLGGGASGSGSVSFAITDDDSGGVTFDPTAVTVTEAAGSGRSATYTVTLGSQPTHNVTVALTTTGATGAASVVPSTLSFTPGDWAARTVTVTATDDSVDQAADRTLTIHHTGTSADSSYSGALGTVAVTVTDDDTTVIVPVVTVSAVTVGPVTEGAGLTFKLTASPPPTEALAVTVNISDAPGDFLAAGVQPQRTVTIPAGQATRNFGVGTHDDGADEADGAVTVTVAAGGGYTVGSPSTASVAVQDDDEPPPPPDRPEIRITGPAATVTEGGAAEFTLHADPAPAADLEVRVRVAAPGGWVAAAQTGERAVTVPAGASTAALSVATVGDTQAEDPPTGTITVTVLTGGGYDPAPPPRHRATATVADDDLLLVTVEDAQAPEGSPLRFRVRLSAPAPSRLELDYTVLPGTATLGRDYTTYGGGVWVEAGETVGEIRLTTRKDAEDDAGETLTVRVTAVRGPRARVDRGVATGTILGPDGVIAEPARIQVTADEDRPATGVYRLRLNTRPPGPVTVTPAASGGVSVSPASVSFDRGDWNRPKTVTVTVPAGARAGTATVTHAVAGYRRAASGPTVEVAVLPDRSRPAVAFQTSASSTSEGRSLLLRLTVTPPALAAFPLRWQVSGTSVAGRDHHLPASGTVFVLADSPTAAISLYARDDGADDGAKTLTVTLTPTEDYKVAAPASHTVTIADTDLPKPTVTISRNAAAVNEGGSAAFTLTAAPPPAEPVSVRLRVDDAPGGRSDFLAPGEQGRRTVTVGTSGTATLTVRTSGDSRDEPDGPVRVTVEAAPRGSYRLGSPASASVTVRDDDPPPAVSVRARSRTIVEGGIAVLELTANRRPHEPLRVRVTVSDAPGSDFLSPAEQGPRTVTVPAGARTATFHVRTTPDTADEPDGNIRVTVQSPGDASYTVRSPASATVAVRDNDEPPGPTVTIAADAPSVDEGQTASFTLTADPPPEAALTVRLDVAAAARHVASADRGHATVTLGARQRTATFTVQTRDDGANSADSRVTVTVRNGNSYTPGSPNTASAAVRDSYTPPTPQVTISARSADVTEGQTAVFTLTARPAPHEPITVTVAVNAPPRFTDPSQRGARQVRIGAGGTGTLTVRTLGDDVDEAHGTVRAALAAGGGYTVGTPNEATVRVLDDDNQPGQSTISISGPTSPATEGDTLLFTIAASPAPQADTAVRVNVADPDGWLAPGQTGTRTVTIPAGRTTAPLALATDDDTRTEAAPGQITARILADAGYETAAAPRYTATATVLDDDGIAVSIADATAAEGEALHFRITLSAPAADDIRIEFALSSDPDQPDRNRRAIIGNDVPHVEWTITVPAGTTEVGVRIPAKRDRQREQTETLRALICCIQHPHTTITRPHAVGTIPKNNT